MPLLKLGPEEAFTNQRRPEALWPRKPDDQARRLVPFCLPELQPSFKITPDDLVFTIGSCFARNIEEHLVIQGFNVAIKQFADICERHSVTIEPGTLNKYVAPSILQELRWAMDPDASYPPEGIVAVSDRRYMDMQLAHAVMPTDLETMQRMRSAVSDYMALAGEASVVIMTLGLSETWYDKQLGLYLNTPPHKGAIKREPDRFEFHLLDYNDILSSLEEIVEVIERFGKPGCRILVTVSPVALASTFTTSDALVANTYSKAVQRAAVEAMRRKFPQIDYMPSFESVTLSDRSLAWREDCAHASDDIVRVNVLRMLAAYTDMVDSEAGSASSIVQRGVAIDLTRKALLLESGGDHEAAEGLIAEALERSPDEVVVRAQAGQFYLGRRNHAAAFEQLSAAIALGGREKYRLSFPLARALVGLKRWDEAEDAFRAAFAEQPQTVAVLFAYAKMLAVTGQGEKAVPILHRCIAMRPEQENFRLLLATIEGDGKAEAGSPPAANDGNAARAAVD